MYKIKLYNNIAKVGLDQFTDQYEVGEDTQDEDAIVVRSANLHELDYGKPLPVLEPVSITLTFQLVPKKGLPSSIHQEPMPMP